MIEGSGSGRPKNMWIRWIRIRNTGKYLKGFFTPKKIIWQFLTIKFDMLFRLGTRAGGKVRRTDYSTNTTATQNVRRYQYRTRQVGRQ
jgi:hypothetical protein